MAEPLTDGGGRGGGGGGGGSEYPEKTPGDELQKMPRDTKARRFKPKARLEPAQQHWWQAKKADVLTVTPRVAPYSHQPARTQLMIFTLFVEIPSKRALAKLQL